MVRKPTLLSIGFIVFLCVINVYGDLLFGEDREKAQVNVKVLTLSERILTKSNDQLQRLESLGKLINILV